MGSTVGRFSLALPLTGDVQCFCLMDLLNQIHIFTHTDIYKHISKSQITSCIPDHCELCASALQVYTFPG